MGLCRRALETIPPLRVTNRSLFATRKKRLKSDPDRRDVAGVQKEPSTVPIATTAHVARMGITTETTAMSR